MAPDQRMTAIFPANHSSKQNDKTKPSRIIRKFTIPPPLKIDNFPKRTPLSYTSSVQERLEKARNNVKKEYKAMTSYDKSSGMETPHHHDYLKEEKSSQDNFPKRTPLSYTSSVQERLEKARNTVKKEYKAMTSYGTISGMETPHHHDYLKEEKSSQGFFYKGMDSASVTPANDRSTLLKKKLESDTSVTTSVVEVNNLENVLCSPQANEKNADFMILESKTCENVDCNLDLPFTTLEEARQSWAAFTKHTHRQAKSKSVSLNDEKSHEMTIDEVSSLDTMTIKITPSRAHSCFAEAAQDYFRLQEIEEQKKKQQKSSINPQNINASTYTNVPDSNGEGKSLPKRQ